MKDIEWFMEQMKSMTRMRDLDSRQESWYISEGALLEALNELDEPEVLSQEWISKFTSPVDDEGRLYVWKSDLENLLVPKQEITEEEAWSKIAEYYPVEQIGLKNAFEHFYYGGFMTDVVVEKPVIPEFVAKWIEECKRKDITLALAYDAGAFSEMGDFLYNEQGDNKNIELFARAWLDGYTVEEEPKYEVRCKGELLLTYYTNIGEVVSMNRWDNHLSKKAGRDWKLRHQLTEQEIKDYDERYFTFAVPVEELEE